MNQNKIGKIIETKRKEKKLTQQQLAELLGVSNTAISKWEHGNNMPDIGLLAPLSEILEIDLITLINTQNSVHEEYSKKYIKLRKIKAYKTIATLVIFIGIICLTNYFTYTKSSNKLKDHISKQTEVYRFTSKDPNFCIDGYIIFNNKESIIVLERVVFQGKDTYEIDYDNIKEVFYYISSTDFHILKKGGYPEFCENQGERNGDFL